ncbi:alkene reductase [Geminocystis sp. NIES-3709]|uniref:alkene reductase n=1 Tax=Geminocystis sp. NIES-3709 TaxID=1617448 RepID=UPI0005FC8230|nr:alkene reductase [Geminocystis sp. NIES-3709]BAQ64964.1 NADH:flavin oxidoreductases [Geminocystis sp. NIES-3709]
MVNLNIFSPFHLGDYILPNRIIMAPMTRLRANSDGTPTELMGTYYAQRATAGLIITEATMISPLSHGYMNCPGIYNDKQTEGWKLVVEKVHQQQGKIFLQLWHSGRISHPALLNGELPIAPSEISAVGHLHTPIGKVSLETPRALDIKEIPLIVEQFYQASVNALNAGFDGVELHGAFGYLIDQFLQDSSNKRTDEYGGSIANRSRFLLEIVEAVRGVWGDKKVGIKLSPSNTFYGISDSNPVNLFSYILNVLNDYNLAYIHLMEPSDIDLATGNVITSVLDTFKNFYNGTIITNGGYDKSKANDVISSEKADLVSFGRPFIANPDLVTRLEISASLNETDGKTIYGQGTNNAEHGYTDYPFLT